MRKKDLHTGEGELSRTGVVWCVEEIGWSSMFEVSNEVVVKANLLIVTNVMLVQGELSQFL